jgi:hypothetical protein
MPFTHLSRRSLFDEAEMAATEIEESSEEITSGSEYSPSYHR